MTQQDTTILQKNSHTWTAAATAAKINTFAAKMAANVNAATHDKHLTLLREKRESNAGIISPRGGNSQ